MYNPQLETFLRVADAGSFNKAAEESYITPTAVIKQIKQRWTRGYKRYKETSGLIEWKECQIFHSIFT